MEGNNKGFKIIIGILLVILVVIIGIIVGNVFMKDNSNNNLNNDTNINDNKDNNSVNNNNDSEKEEEKPWGVEADVSTSNAEYKCAQYFISYPHYTGVKKLTGYVADQGDGTQVVIDSQLAGENVPESLNDVYPLWFEKTSKVLGEYIGSRGSNYQFELLNQKAITVNGKNMARYIGNLTYRYERIEKKFHKWVAYATKIEKNGAYTLWMVLDISEDQSKGSLIEEHAYNMAKSFRED